MSPINPAHLAGPLKGFNPVGRPFGPEDFKRWFHSTTTAAQAAAQKRR